MRRRIKGIEGRKTAMVVGKIILASLVMGAVCYGVSGGISKLAGESFAARIANVTASVGTGAVIFYVCASLLGIEELRAATAAFARRFLKRRG